MDRKDFIRLFSLGTAGMLLLNDLPAFSGHRLVTDNKKIKPITCSWIEFQHNTPEEAKYWNQTLQTFTAKDWREKIKEIREFGIEYLVLLEVADNGKVFYPSSLAPQIKYRCEDPLEAVLAAADEFGIKFFIGNDFWGDWRDQHKLFTDPDIYKIRVASMEEVVKNYGHHASFYGWYFPNESYLAPFFQDTFVTYLNKISKVAHAITPKAVNIIAPYNVKGEQATDEKFVRQLEKMDIDIIAYQDGVGVNGCKPGEAGRYFEHLYQAHQKAGRSRIWADMEVFYFEDKTKGALCPADFLRILTQMGDISPFVERIAIYQYTGIINEPYSKASVGHPNSTKLYTDYKKWYDEYFK
jgi:hypothetical protein